MLDIYQYQYLTQLAVVRKLQPIESCRPYFILKNRIKLPLNIYECISYKFLNNTLDVIKAHT